ncbi:MAG: HAD family hydrolase, partial [Coriobacteriales bacterium]|nr:HAD family hydrolase [Coriobacteriales bacterium]
MSADRSDFDSWGLRPVAVFDYDGTFISGQSGLLLSEWLLKRGVLSPRTVVGLGWWGARYKLHLPYRHALARELIFSDIGALGIEEVDRLMSEFYDEVLVPRYRPKALEELARRKTEGCATLLVSATFETIARRAAAQLGLDGFVATQMELDADGHYTGEVLGEVIAGKAKVKVARDWADQFVGKGRWYLAHAYGDHHTDIELLSASLHPHAV